jgi:hypothetical protein
MLDHAILSAVAEQTVAGRGLGVRRHSQPLRKPRHRSRSRKLRVFMGMRLTHHHVILSGVG